MPALKALSFIVHISLYLSLFLSFLVTRPFPFSLSLDPTYDSLILLSLDSTRLDSARIALDSGYFY